MQHYTLQLKSDCNRKARRKQVNVEGVSYVHYHHQPTLLRSVFGESSIWWPHNNTAISARHSNKSVGRKISRGWGATEKIPKNSKKI